MAKALHALPASRGQPERGDGLDHDLLGQRSGQPDPAPGPAPGHDRHDARLARAGRWTDVGQIRRDRHFPPADQPLTLLGDDPGWFHRLRRDYGLPDIRFTLDSLHILRAADGRPLDDIRGVADNEAIADAITAKVEQGKAGIRAEIAGIWRMASSEDLAEEMFESLRRRIEAKLKERAAEISRRIASIVAR